MREPATGRRVQVPGREQRGDRDLGSRCDGCRASQRRRLHPLLRQPRRGPRPRRPPSLDPRDGGHAGRGAPRQAPGGGIARRRGRRMRAHPRRAGGNAAARGGGTGRTGRPSLRQLPRHRGPRHGGPRARRRPAARPVVRAARGAGGRAPRSGRRRRPPRRHHAGRSEAGMPRLRSGAGTGGRRDALAPRGAHHPRRGAGHHRGRAPHLPRRAELRDHPARGRRHPDRVGGVHPRGHAAPLRAHEARGGAVGGGPPRRPPRARPPARLGPDRGRAERRQRRPRRPRLLGP